MTNYETAKHTRDEQISEHLKENTSVYSTNKKLNDSATEFVANTKKKKDLMADLSVTTAGFTTSKAEAREELTESLLDICGFGVAFAHDIGDNTMLQLMNNSKWAIGRLGQEAFDAFAGKVIKMADDKKLPMADYGLSKAILDEASANHLSYQTAKPLPAETEGKITAINNSIDDLQDKNDRLLEFKLEKLIPTFRKTNSEFVDTFHALNKIVNPAVSHTKVHAIITDAQGNPLPNVTLTFQSQDKSFKMVTGSNGEITEKIPYGVYDINLSIEDLQSILLKEEKIKKGKTHKLNIKMS